jgi:ATP-dependent Lon protease
MFFRDKQAESERSLPLLPLRDMVVFPHTPVSLVVGRPRSLAAVAAARTQKVDLVVVAQRDPADADPGPEDLYTVGTLCVIEQTLRLPDGNVKVLLEGKRRVRIDRYTENTAFLEVVVSSGEPVEAPPESGVLVRTVHAAFERYAKLNRAVPPEMLLQVNATDDPDRLADMLVASLQLKLPERQELLEVFAPHARLERVYKALLAEIEFAQVERKLKTRVRRDKETGQREQWLQDQMKAIQRELGDRDAKGEMEELAQQLAAAQLPDPIRDRAEKELRKLSQMNLMSAEATVVRNYLDWVLALPWTARSGPAPSLEQAAAILAEDHYGLTKVKERVLEYLAVSHLRSCASWGRPGSARRRWPAASRARSRRPSCASRWAASATKRRSAATAARTSARCRASCCTR